MSHHLFDSHCHLDFDDFDDDRKQVLENAFRKGVRRILVPGTRCGTPLDFSAPDVDIKLHFGVGLHPYFIADHKQEHLDWIAEQLENDASLLVGEIGLDRTCDDWQKQCNIFAAQLELAIDYQRPMILHHRKTQSDLLELITPQLNDLPETKGVLHAFSGSPEQAEDWISKGFKLGVGGTITYERAKKTREAIAKAPLKGLVLETDAPDMPLAGYQGERNEPCRVAEVFSQLVELRQESAEELAQALWANSCELIGCSAADASDDNATC
ncbi:TatD family hydrolase [Pseudidiomarina insulisalsae]|uniref:TatD family deoxyribonuclease n=1 Tax=Pseudidiomarina insulisalsae TaxID=575789 RepID=A0A432Y8R0_9GAMM|nr:TatD family hydrolase [Pseudidiomarina insulisalsae]RUO57323.1 TatD family deoxyribonuclease [Pseudidiomarina insulisalsae]